MPPPAINGILSPAHNEALAKDVVATGEGLTKRVVESFLKQPAALVTVT